MEPTRGLSLPCVCIRIKEESMNLADSVGARLSYPRNCRCGGAVRLTGETIVFLTSASRVYNQTALFGFSIPHTYH